MSIHDPDISLKDHMANATQDAPAHETETHDDKVSSTLKARFMTEDGRLDDERYKKAKVTIDESNARLVESRNKIDEAQATMFQGIINTFAKGRSDRGFIMQLFMHAYQFLRAHEMNDKNKQKMNTLIASNQEIVDDYEKRHGIKKDSPSEKASGGFAGFRIQTGLTPA